MKIHFLMDYCSINTLKYLQWIIPAASLSKNYRFFSLPSSVAKRDSIREAHCTSTIGITTWYNVCFLERVRSVCAGLSGAFCYAIMFVASYTFPWLSADGSASSSFSLGLTGTFLLYGLFALISVLFAMCFVPETKGKTLQDIELLFKAKRREDDNRYMCIYYIYSYVV